MTQGKDNKKELSLWVCTPDLKPTLLLRDDQQKLLDRSSFCRFLQGSFAKEPPTRLVCTVGKEQRFVLFYTMPEELKEEKASEL